MGFSTTGTHMIFFIASIGIVAGLIFVVNSTSDSITQGIVTRSVDVSEEMRTDIKIIHVDTSSPLLIYVLNTGSTTLSANDTSLMIDGNWTQKTLYTVSIVPRATDITNAFWDPQEVIEINSLYVPGSGRHVAKVIVQKGVYNEYRFDIA